MGIDCYVEVLSKEMHSKKEWKDKDYYMVVAYATSYGITMGKGCAYFAGGPHCRYGTCEDEELLEIVDKMYKSKNPEELKMWAFKLQEYVAREVPIIALMWGKAMIPYRTDRWKGWVPTAHHGACSYWTLFNLEPINK